MASVRLENLSRTYTGPQGREVRAVDGLNLAVESGELLVLVGPSGSGKTTLLRMIAGLDQPSSGAVWIDGENVTAKPPEARQVAMVSQEHSLYPHLTINRNLAFGLMLRRFGTEEISARVREAADLLGLTPLLDRLPQHLSGGERQRVALGRALVLRPKLFLLDEPLSNLDTPLRAQMRREIARLHRRVGATMLYVTHDQVEAMTLADRLAVIDRGVLQQVGRPREVYDHPANRFVAGFIGTPPMNFFLGRLVQTDSAVEFCGETTGDGEPLAFELDPEQSARCRSFWGEKVIFGIRPEHLRPLDHEEKPKPDEAPLTAEVTGVEPLGWETHLHARGFGIDLVARLASDCPVQVGQGIRLAFQVSKGHWFNATNGESVPWAVAGSPK